MEGRVALVADLHLGAGSGPEWTDSAAAFADFVGALPALGVGRLMVLGDFLELLSSDDSSPGEAARARIRCASVLDRVPRVTDALAGFTAAGGCLDVIVGNHDADLARPEVANCLLERISGSHPGESRVAIFPWFRILPGVLYAEHGHQHHDINRFPLILDPYRPLAAERLHEPLAVTLHRTADQGRMRRARSLWASAVVAERRERDARSEIYRDSLAAYGRGQGLPPGVSGRLDRVSEFSRARTSRRLLARELHRRPRDAYLLRAAESLDQVLRDEGCAQPVYAFGHTHRARVAALGSGALYTNPGSWSPWGPSGAQRHPYLLLDPTSIGAGVERLAWGPG